MWKSNYNDFLDHTHRGLWGISIFYNCYLLFDHKYSNFIFVFVEDLNSKSYTAEHDADINAGVSEIERIFNDDDYSDKLRESQGVKSVNASVCKSYFLKHGIISTRWNINGIPEFA